MENIQKEVLTEVRTILAALIFITTFYVVDFPLKFLGLSFCFVLVIIFTIFNIKRQAPKWIAIICDYALSSELLIATIAYNKCKVCEKEQKEY